MYIDRVGTERMRKHRGETLLADSRDPREYHPSRALTSCPGVQSSEPTIATDERGRLLLGSFEGDGPFEITQEIMGIARTIGWIWGQTFPDQVQEPLGNVSDDSRQCGVSISSKVPIPPRGNRHDVDWQPTRQALQSHHSERVQIRVPPWAFASQPKLRRRIGEGGSSPRSSKSRHLSEIDHSQLPPSGQREQDVSRFEISMPIAPAVQVSEHLTRLGQEGLEEVD